MSSTPASSLPRGSWWTPRAWAIEAGYPSDGEPGLRPQHRDDYCGAFVHDPHGNNVYLVSHNR